MMKFSYPKTAREWQWAQHIVGGLYSILLIITGAYFGRGDWTIGIILGALTFITNRISSEIAYQVQYRLIKERNIK